MRAVARANWLSQVVRSVLVTGVDGAVRDALHGLHFDFRFLVRRNASARFWHNDKRLRALDIAQEATIKVSIPVLTIHGRKDRNAPYGGGREWDMLLPNARLITIDDAAHMSWVEFPEIVFPSIELFLNGQWLERAQPVKSLELPAR